MLGNTTLGTAIWPGFLIIREWLMNTYVTAVFRGIMIGTGFGAISMGVRIMLGLERGVFGQGGEE